MIPMKRQPKTMEIDGRTFVFLPMPARVAGPYNLKFLKVAVPLLTGLQSIGGILPKLLEDAPKNEAGELDFEKLDLSALLKQDLGKILSLLDFNAISFALTNALDALAPHELDYLTLGMLQYVQTHVEGKGNCTLVTAELVDAAFDDVGTMYKVLFEVARFNKFRPFGLGSSGEEIPKTAG